MKTIRTWAPTAIFVLGSFLLLGIDSQQHVDLAASLDVAVPRELLGLGSRDLTLPPEEAEIAGMDTYLLRTYAANATDPQTGSVRGFSIYVGFYGSQAQGRTIHSPKNCLPGTGWEALSSRQLTIQTPRGEVPVNQYLLQKGQELALVLYWYQGRGRVEANEYRVKLDLLMDSALYGRSDEALVRIVVPVETSEAAAQRAARQVAEEIIPAVDTALPAM